MSNCAKISLNASYARCCAVYAAIAQNSIPLTEMSNIKSIAQQSTANIARNISDASQPAPAAPVSVSRNTER